MRLVGERAKVYFMDGFDKDLIDETTRAVGPDVWMFVAMIAATFVVAGLVLLGLCVHV
jgi:hypothetical protein